ncbi:hypothetical protein K438DRAFT_1977188 [Mycena galopus ATCC 62051]|nr:hypothetical protein K438DRAFT_2004151 [Mycena galopus ATCC 62051]KAF8179828.1 hypothetical protein K438DRAFT_1977188 [Mycena galopus ATCC 62051]
MPQGKLSMRSLTSRRQRRLARRLQESAQVLSVSAGNTWGTADAGWGPAAWPSPETQETAAHCWADYAAAAVLVEQAAALFLAGDKAAAAALSAEAARLDPIGWGGAWGHEMQNPAQTSWIEASAAEAARIAAGGLEATWP